MTHILERFRLDGQVAIVTGSGRGIGAAIALALAQAGANIVVTARSRDQLEQTAVLIREVGQQALIIPCDITDKEQRNALVDQTLKHFGRIDILVNNAGGSLGMQPTLATSAEHFDACFSFNATAAYAMSVLCAPHMAKTEHGAIVNISSVAAQIPQPGFISYGVAKAALNFMTKNLAQDFAPKVRVNAIAVGSTLTSSLEAIMTEELEQAIVSRTPMNRLGQPEDIAACTLFLASPAASYVTGEIYGVNGGLTTAPIDMPRSEL